MGHREGDLLRENVEHMQETGLMAVHVGRGEGIGRGGGGLSRLQVLVPAPHEVHLWILRATPESLSVHLFF